MKSSISRRYRGPARTYDPPLSVRVAPEVVKALDKLAANQELSRGDLVRKILAEYVKRQRKK